MTLGKKLLVASFIFLSGFLTHALVFPDILSNGIVFIPDITSTNMVDEQEKKAARNIFTTILFDGKRFNRSNVTLRVSDYIIIKNTSKTDAMWLLSKTKELATNRDFRESEQVREKLDIAGTYAIQEKYTGQKIIITVK